MVLVAIAMVAIIAMAAMSIDLVTLYLAREEAQRAADAGALAAARVISASGITGTAAPANNPAAWALICGPVIVGSTNGWATQAATSVAAQNTVGGHAVNVSVTYFDGTQSGGDCSALGAAFAVNPMITVQVTPVTIPSFFSRIWGSTGNAVSASATAEVFNPTNSATEGVNPNTTVTPVQPRCVKPLIVPNIDPGNGGCTATGSTRCLPFVAPGGSLGNPGISPAGDGVTGVIGERFWLYADCTGGTDCTGTNQIDSPPTANSSSSLLPPPPPPFTGTLEYLPGAVGAWAAAVPSSCNPSTNFYQSAVAGCDRSTVYQCGLLAAQSGNPNQLDLTENPGGVGGDAAVGLACALTNTTTVPLDGEDTLRTGYPFLPIAGNRNPAVPTGTPITNSNSVISLPIYDGTPLGAGTNPPVTIVGFLQVFVNDVDANGNIQVTVLNVAGCGSNTSTNPPVFGNSPLPVRLITPQPAQ